MKFNIGDHVRLKHSSNLLNPSNGIVIKIEGLKIWWQSSNGTIFWNYETSLIFDLPYHRY